MSLAAISLTAPRWQAIASQRQPPAQPAPIADAEPVQSAQALSQEIEAQKESSLAYQLIKQLLIQHSESESSALSIDTDDMDINLAHSRSTSTTLAMDADSLSLAWSQSESFAAVITGEGFSLSISAVRVQSFQLELEREVAQSDPLQLDLAGDGFETTGLSWAVRFDITGDGRTEQVSVAADDDALLALDHNRNGRIDSGKELFGDQHGRANGYAELRRYDDNHDQLIDASDAIFSALQLLRWRHDGSQQLQSLTDAGIVSISLQDAVLKSRQTEQGDTVSTGSTVRFDDGRERQMADLWYRYWAAS